MSVIFRRKTLGLQYMLLLLRFYVFFRFLIQKSDFLRCLLCFTRFLELWYRIRSYDAYLRRLCVSLLKYPIEIEFILVLAALRICASTLSKLITELKYWNELNRIELNRIELKVLVLRCRALSVNSFAARWRHSVVDELLLSDDEDSEVEILEKMQRLRRLRRCRGWDAWEDASVVFLCLRRRLMMMLTNN